MASTSFPVWLDALAWASIAIAIACAVFVTIDVIRRPPHMRVMAIVWPVSMLFGGLLWLALYLSSGRAPRRGTPTQDMSHDERPTFISIAKGTTHCGAGCTLGDLIAEWLAFGIPAIAVVFGYGWLFSDEMFAVWVLDFILAFGIGIVLQYYAIAPARGLTVREGIREALKADTASIVAWQVGMYAVMALIQLVVFPALFGGRASVASPEFWFAMQWAMLAGFATSFPVNALLIRRGIKTAM